MFFILEIVKWRMFLTRYTPIWFTVRFVLVFHSMKFLNKIQYVHSLDELAEIVPMEHVHVPECVVQ